MILLLQIFLELSDKMDWTKVPGSDDSLPEFATSAEVFPVGSFMPFECPLKVINFDPFSYSGENIVRGQTFSQ